MNTPKLQCPSCHGSYEYGLGHACAGAAGYAGTFTQPQAPCMRAECVEGRREIERLRANITNMVMHLGDMLGKWTQEFKAGKG